MLVLIFGAEKCVFLRDKNVWGIILTNEGQNFEQ